MKKLENFYTNLLITHEVMGMSNQSKESIRSRTKKKEMKQVEGSNAESKFLISSIKSNIFRSIIIKIFDEMKRLGFKELPSVNQLYQTGNDVNRYNKLAKIDLHSHTVSAAVECKKILEDNNANTPDEAKAICIILTLLHDFGKSPIIEKDYKEEQNYRHQHISAIYAKKLLMPYLKQGLSKETIELIYKCIYTHHDVIEQDNNFFRQVLNEADKKTREKEIFFVDAMSGK